jgi:hypothetical protein
VQALPSLQADPLAWFGFEQTPVEGSQLPATRHASLAVHTTGLPPVQTPAWQVSVSVQPFPSLQPEPSDVLGFEQTPDDGSQAPAT